MHPLVFLFGERTDVDEQVGSVVLNDVLVVDETVDPVARSSVVTEHLSISGAGVVKLVIGLRKGVV